MEVERWTTTRIPTGLSISQQCGIETKLELTDIDITIHQLTMYDPNGHSETISFCSFNHEYPTPETTSFKAMVNKFIVKLKNQLMKQYPPPASLSFAERTSYSTQFKCKLETHPIEFPEEEGKDIRIRTNQIFQIRKNLLLLFWIHGLKMFDYHLMPTGNRLALGTLTYYHTEVKIAQVFWIFPWDYKQTQNFLMSTIKMWRRTNCLYYLYELNDSDPSGVVTDDTSYHNIKYYWIPNNANTDMIRIYRIRREFVIGKLLNILIPIFMKITEHCVSRFSLEMFDHIMSFLRQSDIDFIMELFKTVKLKPTIDNMEQLCLSEHPVPFFQRKQYIEESDDIHVYSGNSDVLEISKFKKLILVDKDI
jgi:hypothetical protein